MRQLTKYERLMKRLTRTQRGWTQKIHRSAEDVSRLRAEVKRSRRGSRRRGRRRRPLKLSEGTPPQKRRRLATQQPAQAWAQEILEAKAKKRAQSLITKQQAGQP